MGDKRILGITVEIGGNVSKLKNAMSDVNKDISRTKASLKDVERLLKLDPTNTELLRQKQALLGKEISDTKDKLKVLREAEKQAQQQFKEGKISEERYEALKREVIATEQSLKQLKETAKESNVVLSQISEVTGNFADASGKLADKTKMVSAAATGLVGAAVASSLGFEDSFAKVSTLLDESRTDYDKYKEAIIEGSNETGIAAGDFAEAVYSAMSAGVDQADAVAFVTEQAKLAKGGFTDMSKAVDITTTAINGYKMEAKDASKINDLLITTQNEGKTTVDELASSMGQVIPVASAANFELEELSAGYALLTKKGISTSVSGTYMKSMLSELTKSGSIADKTLRELTGKGFADLKKEGMSTSEILNLLSEEAQKSDKTLKDMFGSTEAGSAALVLASSNGEEFDEMLQKMKESAGATDEAFEKVTGTTGESLRRSFNELKNTGIELGDTLAPIIENIADAISKVTGVLSMLDEEQLAVITSVLLAVAALSPLLSGISKVSSGIQFLVDNPILMLIAAIVGLVALIGTKGDEIQGVLQQVDDFLQGIFVTDWTQIFGPILGNVLNAFFADVKNIWDSIKLIFDGIINFIRGAFTGDWRRAWNGVKQIFSRVFNALTAVAKSPLNGIIGLLNMAIAKINSMINGFNSIGFDMPDWLGGGSWHPDIPNIPSIAYLANGGILSSGSAVVGEAGPEILTVSGNQAMVQPLTGNASAGKGLSELMGLLNTYLPYLAESSDVILDSGEFVGVMAPKMNNEFGKIASRERQR